MATPPEGPALDKERDTKLDLPDEGIAHDRTATPAGETSLSSLLTSYSIEKYRELQVGVMVGEYRIDGLLGEGGMGRVYSATHPVIGKKAAVKVLHPRMSGNPEVVDRFAQEARAVNQIGHPNIVDIFAFGELADGQSYFVMECLKGESLQERIRREPLSLDEVCAYVTDITHALEAAHDKGIIHRDLKPENVFLHQIKNGLQIKLLDFGIAKLANNEDTRLERTRTGAMMGTPKYIAPEQARGYAVDARVDIYSLGVMMFELIARRLPFIADNAMDLVASHLHDVPPRLSSVVGGVPRNLDNLVDAMLAKKADDRPSLASVRQVLAAPDHGSSTDMVPVAAHSLYVEAPRRGKALVFGAIALAGVVGGAVAVTQLRGGDPPAPVAPPTSPAPATVAPTPSARPAAPPAVVKPALFAVTVTARMKGTLTVDDKDAPGTTPWTLELAPGPHTVQFKPTKGDAIRKQIEVVAAPIDIEFSPPVTKPVVRPPVVKPPVIKPPVIKDAPKPPVVKPPGDDDFLDPKKR